MTLKALIFDVDGTLAETEELHRQAFNEAFSSLGISWTWSQSLYKNFCASLAEKSAFFTIWSPGTRKTSPAFEVRFHPFTTSRPGITPQCFRMERSN
jgi:beta-phosphoglucomutase-like phosphatase (HAD superfamily)